MNKIVIGIVEKNNSFLMARRIAGEGDLTWTFPGGLIETGETEEEAIEREIFEETNIKTKAFQKFGERVHPTTSREICYWLCKYVSGEIELKDTNDLDKIEWMTADEIFKNVTSNIFQPIKDYLLTNLDDSK